MSCQGPMGPIGILPDCKNLKELCDTIKEWYDMHIEAAFREGSSFDVEVFVSDSQRLIDKYNGYDETSFVDRMKKELDELEAKCYALDKFIKSIKYLELDEENRSLLNAQYNCMLTYATILKRRIKINGGN